MNTELVMQIQAVLRYLQDSADKLDFSSMKESASQILSLLTTSFCDESTQEDADIAGRILNTEPFDLGLFCDAVSTILIKVSTSQADKLSKDNSILKAKIDSATDIIKEKNEQLSNLLQTISHISHISRIYHKKYKIESEQFLGRGAVYTAVTGGYDHIIEPQGKAPELDYIYFSDALPDIYKGEWTFRKLDNPLGLSPVKLARWAKMHPCELLPDYDWSIWIDGSICAKSNIREFVELYRKKSGMICFPHHSSGSIYEEARDVIRCNKAKETEINKQIEKYKEQGFPCDDYIVETGCLVRNHHDEVLHKVMDDWWNELNSYEHSRDQLSFNYACWKNGYDFDICDLPVYNNLWMYVETAHEYPSL